MRHREDRGSLFEFFLMIVLAVVICLPGAARAEICSADDVPAATLLLPYFEVELDDPQGPTTMFSINNARAESTLAHIVLWSDLGVPTLDFDVYLTGYDVLTINLRDLFRGIVPVTNPVGPVGAFSLPNTQFPECDSVLPLPSTLPQVFLEHLRNAHTGRPSRIYGGLCAGADLGDRIARGYLTADVTKRCSLIFPTEEGYFGPEGPLAHDNVLWGDFYLVDPGEGLAQGENLVRLESNPEAFEPGDRTFYGAYVNGDASDGREPLPAFWAGRFAEGGAFNGGTEFLVWRSPPVREPFDCGTPLADLTLGSANQITAFDEEENPTLVIPCQLPPVSPPITLFPVFDRITQKASPRDFDCFGPEFGWLAADLRAMTSEGEPDESSQGWMSSQVSAAGRFSVGVSGTALSPSCGVVGSIP